VCVGKEIEEDGTSCRSLFQQSDPCYRAPGQGLTALAICLERFFGRLGFPTQCVERSFIKPIVAGIDAIELRVWKTNPSPLMIP